MRVLRQSPTEAREEPGRGLFGGLQNSLSRPPLQPRLDPRRVVLATAAPSDEDRRQKPSVYRSPTTATSSAAAAIHSARLNGDPLPPP